MSLTKCLSLAVVVAAAVSAPVYALAPKVVSIQPKPGSTDVDAATTAIIVMFDQEMGEGMSWTGGGPAYPNMRKGGKKPGWSDPRTCVLPVELEAAKVYRLGLNSQSHKNFQSKAGEPLVPQTIVFATKGASAEQVAQMKAPRVVKFSPENGAKDVDPATKEISVTFDQPMGPGMSWTGGGENFPEMEGPPKWDESRRTCTATVKLKPNHTYRLGINSVSFQNFQNELGVPVEPVEYTFKTTDGQ